jgi:hypothetical protein
LETVEEMAAASGEVEFEVIKLEVVEASSLQIKERDVRGTRGNVSGVESTRHGEAASGSASACVKIRLRLLLQKRLQKVVGVEWFKGCSRG